jgi:hypothetical protein
VIIAVSVLLLGAGVVLGFLPVRATLTQIVPELRLVTVSCGNGYLQATPPVQPGDLVALPGEAGVYLPRTTYAEHCGEAAGWRRYAAWGLTALGALGLAITFSSAGPATRRVPSGARGGVSNTGEAPAGGTEPEEDTASANGSAKDAASANGSAKDAASANGSADGSANADRTQPVATDRADRAVEPANSDGQEPESLEPAQRRATRAGARGGRHALRADTDS